MKKFDADTKIAVGLLPQDLATGTGAKSGAWVSLANYDSLTALYMSDVGTAGQDVTVKLQQATAAGGGGSKDLNAGQWFIAQNATVGDIGDALDTDGTAGEFEDDGETACVARIEVTADQLDVAGGFEFVRVHCTDAGTTAGKLGSVAYILRGARYAQAVVEQPSVLS